MHSSKSFLFKKKYSRGADDEKVTWVCQACGVFNGFSDSTNS